MNKILVIGPILAQWSEIKFIEKSLSFLNMFSIDYLDPLENITDESTSTFFEKWFIKLKKLRTQYDGFMGFSLGGIILQRCFEHFEGLNKSIVLFSTPSLINEILYHRLMCVIDLLKNESLESGIKKKNEFVSHPYNAPIHNSIHDENLAQARLSHGLNYVLQTNSDSLLRRSNVPYLHLIGKESLLVNRDNVNTYGLAQLITVPSAGMRVLQDNLPYCIPPIIDFLKGK